MSSEKLRRETTRADITIIRNEDNNRFYLEGTLPPNIKPSDFIGQICVLKEIVDGAVPNNPDKLQYRYRYGVITEATSDEVMNISANVYGISKVRLSVLFRFAANYSDLQIYFDYYPQNGSTGTVQASYLMSNLSPSDNDTYREFIDLDKSVDSTTGDVTYSGSGFVHISNLNYAQLIQHGYLILRTKEKVGYTPKYSVWSKITAIDTNTKNIYLDRYLIWPEDKVTNAQITMTDVGSQPSTRYFGFKMYPITVTFTVPAANL